MPLHDAFFHRTTNHFQIRSSMEKVHLRIRIRQVVLDSIIHGIDGCLERQRVKHPSPTAPQQEICFSRPCGGCYQRVFFIAISRNHRQWVKLTLPVVKGQVGLDEELIQRHLALCLQSRGHVIRSHQQSSPFRAPRFFLSAIVYYIFVIIFGLIQ